MAWPSDWDRCISPYGHRLPKQALCSIFNSMQTSATHHKACRHSKGWFDYRIFQWYSIQFLIIKNYEDWSTLRLFYQWYRSPQDRENWRDSIKKLPEHMCKLASLSGLTHLSGAAYDCVCLLLERQHIYAVVLCMFWRKTYTTGSARIVHTVSHSAALTTLACSSVSSSKDHCLRVGKILLRNPSKCFATDNMRA